MAGKEGDYYKKGETKEGGFLKFLYNPDTKEVFGRTGLSWCKFQLDLLLSPIANAPGTSNRVVVGGSMKPFDAASSLWAILIARLTRSSGRVAQDAVPVLEWVK